MKNRVPFNRRQFIKGVGATAVLLQLPVWQSCKPTIYKGILSADNQFVINNVLQILFPSKPGPDIYDIKVEKHLNNYLTDPLIDPDEQQFIINGIGWIRETAQEKFENDFLLLSRKQQEKLIKFILSKPWGENWVSKLLTILFEAMLLDPVYGINTHEIGWRFLHHVPGKPRPENYNKYPEILQRKNENIIITDLKQL